MYNNFLSIHQAKERMLPLLQGSSIRCALCDKEFNRITARHLRMHSEKLDSIKGVKWYKPKRNSKKNLSIDYCLSQEDLTIELQQNEVLEQRPETLVETYERVFQGVSKLNLVVRKLFDLYQPSRVKWLLMGPPISPRYATWYTVTSDNPSFLPNRLCAPVVTEHLLFKSAIGVFSKSKYKTSFLVFDVDVTRVSGIPQWIPEIESKNAALSISKVLSHWGFQPHISISGGKGYHITLFFESSIRFEIAMKLFNAVIQYPWVPKEGPGLRIECLPIQHGAKLPLGIHFEKETFTGFVDPYTFDQIKNPYEYLLNIMPDSPELITEIQDTNLSVSRERKSSIIHVDSWKKERVESAYKLGIILPHTRHDTLVKVAVFIRNSSSLCPPTLQEFINVLVDWSKKQYEMNSENIQSSWSEHTEDVNRVAKYVWKRPMSQGVNKQVTVKASIVHWIRSKTNNLAAQQLLFAAWFQKELVGGEFYFGYEQMRHMASLAKATLDKSIKTLREQETLIMTANYVHSSGIISSRTRKYRISDLPPNSNDSGVLLVIERDKWDSTLWFRLLRTLFTIEQLKPLYPHSYHRILKVDPIWLDRLSS